MPKITTPIETYQKKLQQYEQAYIKATQRKHDPDEVTQKQLQQTWQALGLREGDVRAIATQINTQIQSYQANLRQYEQEFVDATEQQYPLSETQRRELQQRQRSLNLGDQDVSPIESRIIADVEEHRQKIQQYKQVFTESIQYEYPLTDETRNELKHFQTIIELSNEIVGQIEEDIVASKKINLELDTELYPTEKADYFNEKVEQKTISSQQVENNNPSESILISSAQVELDNTSSATSRKKTLLIGGSSIVALLAVGIIFTNKNQPGPGLPTFTNSISCKCTSLQCSWFDQTYHRDKIVTVINSMQNTGTNDWAFELSMPDGTRNYIQTYTTLSGKYTELNGKRYELGDSFRKNGIVGLGAGTGWNCH